MEYKIGRGERERNLGGAEGRVLNVEVDDGRGVDDAAVPLTKTAGAGSEGLLPHSKSVGAHRGAARLRGAWHRGRLMRHNQIAGRAIDGGRGSDSGPGLGEVLCRRLGVCLGDCMGVCLGP